MMQFQQRRDAENRGQCVCVCVAGTYMNCVGSRLATDAALGSLPYDYCTLQQVCTHVTYSPGSALLWP